MQVYLPSFIDIDVLKKESAHWKQPTFDINNAILIIDFIIRRMEWAYNKDIEHVGGPGYVSITRSQLRQITKHYKLYTDFLEQLGFLLICRRYEKGKYSYGYLIPPESQLIPCNKQLSFQSVNIINTIPKLYSYDHAVIDTPTTILSPYLLDLTISTTITLSSPITLKDFIGVYRQQRILNRDYYCYRDPTTSRLHSNLTNLNKELRRYLTYNGHQLTNVDLCNSQPYLFLALMNPNFWSNKRTDNRIIFDDLQLDSIRFTKKQKQAIISLTESITQTKDYLQFKDAVLSGKFYEDMYKLLYEKELKSEAERDKIKVIVLKLLYNMNGAKSAEKDLFIAKFPNVFALISLIKEKSYKHLSHILQRVESFLIIDNVVPAIHANCNNLAMFTIHDSISGLPESTAIIKSAIEEHSIRLIGFKPILNIKYWK